MKTTRVIFLFIARFFLSIYFLITVYETMMMWSDGEKILMDALCQWQSFTGFSDSVQECLTVLVPWAPMILAVGILIAFVGGIMVLFGYRERLGAGLLCLFVITTTLLFHPFWFFDSPMRESHTALFFKDLAILGGLIIVAVHGAREHSGGSSVSSMDFS